MKTIDAEHFLIDASLGADAPPPAHGYPYDLPAVRHLDTLVFDPAVTYLVGENGSGKSTLLEALAIALGFNAEGGTRNFRFATRASHSDLHEHLELRRGLKSPRSGFFLRAESFYNVATQVEQLDVGRYSYGTRSLHEQSHGESFLTLFLEKFQGNSLYLLDEPEAALSPARQLAVLARMHDLVEEGAQFIIATHSPILMAYPGATIVLLEEDGIRVAEYEETEHFQITRQFLNNRERMLRELFREPPPPP